MTAPALPPEALAEQPEGRPEETHDRDPDAIDGSVEPVAQDWEV